MFWQRQIGQLALEDHRSLNERKTALSKKCTIDNLATRSQKEKFTYLRDVSNY